MKNSKKMPKGRKHQSVTAAPIGAALSASGNTLTWSYTGLPANEQVIWTFIQYGTALDGNGNIVISSSISIYEKDWIDKTGSYITSFTFNSATDPLGFRSLAPGTYYMRLSGSNGDPSDAATWNIFVSNTVPVTIS